MEKFTCCICGKTVIGWGNNPAPISLKKGDKCCNECNDSVVISARLDLILGGNQNGKK